MNQFPVVADHNGNKINATSLDQLVMLGKIAEKGALSVHVEGGKHHGSGVQIDITGHEGDLRITNRSAFGNEGDDYVIEGAKAGDDALRIMPVPASYNTLPTSDNPSAVLELGELYAAYARDVAEGTHTAPVFEDALRMHQLFDAMSLSTLTGSRISLLR